MPDRGGGPTGPRMRVGRPSRRVRTLLMTLGVLAVLGMVFTMFAGFWTDWLWYRSVNYSSVFTTTLWTKIGLFFVFGLLMALAVGFNIWLAHRLRPPLSAMSMEQQNLDRYRMGIAPYKKWLLIAITALVGLIAGASASSQWRTWLMWVNGVPFGEKDPQFHLDVGFYAFDLPWYRFLLGFGFAAVILSVIAAALTHYLYGGLRITSPGARATAAATGHLSVLLGIFVALKAVAYWLDRYGLAVKSSDFKATDNWTGLRYVDANAYLPAKTILFCIAVICALLFFATLWRRTWQLPVIGFGLMVLSAILIGGLYPAIVQKFQVQPNEQAKEAPYVEKNLKATRDAYGIDGTQVTEYPGTSETEDKTKLRDDVGSTASIRIMDPNIVSPTFQQLQQIRNYYAFPTNLDVDRYSKDGKDQDTVIGLREINLNGIPKRNWINDHFRYTHGYGAVAAEGTNADSQGRPDFTESDLPSKGDLGRTELLRAVVASLAAAERPDRLGIVLIDGRDTTGAGGGHGEGLGVCTDVPHVTTHLTANDPVRMREFAQSLSAELKRRAELLGRSDFTEWHTGRELSGRMVAQRAVVAGDGDLESPPSATIRLRPGAARRQADAVPPLPRLVVVVDDLDALLLPALGSPGRPAAGSVIRALEAVARDGERLGVHLVAATGPGGRAAESEPARRATLRVTLDAVTTGPDAPAPGRGRLLRPDGRAVPFQGGRVTGRIPRTATLRPTVVPLEWHRMGDPPARRPVRELGNGPTDLALLASALERAAREVSAAGVPSLL
ncbi:UPF0182 family protein [Streptomyces nigra]